MLALLASFGPWGEALAKIFGYVAQRDAAVNTPEMKMAEDARKDQELKDKINKAISNRDEKATRDGLA